MSHLSLRIKLLIFTLGVGLGSMLLVGYLVDRNLLSYHQAAAQELIEEGFAGWEARLVTLEAALIQEAGFLAEEERLLAGLSLINRFQDTQNYQAILFDEEKQRLVSRLQTSVQSSLSTGAFVYDLEGQLVGFVQEQGLERLQGFVSYKQGKPQLLGLRAGRQTAQPLEASQQKAIFQQAKQHQELSPGLDYGHYQDDFFLTKKYPLEDWLGGEKQLQGYLVLVHQLQLSFLTQVMPTSLEAGLLGKQDQRLLGDPLRAVEQELLALRQAGSSAASLKQTSAGFWSWRPLQATDGQLQAVFLYPMASYQAARASTGQAILIAVLIAALLILPLSLALVRNLVTRPLEQLSEGLEGIRRGDLLTPIELNQDDELGQFAKTLASMANQLYQREESLNASNKELLRLSEVMAHHFQEPTRRLMAFSRHLQKSKDPALNQDSQIAIAFIEEQAERLSHLVSDVQRYLELDRVRLPDEWVDLDALLQAILQDPEIDAQVQSLNAQIKLGPLPRVYFSRRRLKEIFTALLANALAYHHPERPLKVEIKSQKVKDCNSIYITDNGKGIEPKYRLQVFDLFIRLVSTDQNPGTGMGLAMVRRLMKQAGGDIRIEEGLEGGTTFVLSFPDQELNWHD